MPICNSFHLDGKFSDSSCRLEISIKELQDMALNGISSVAASTSIYNLSHVSTLIEIKYCMKCRTSVQHKTILSVHKIRVHATSNKKAGIVFQSSKSIEVNSYKSDLQRNTSLQQGGPFCSLLLETLSIQCRMLGLYRSWGMKI